MPCFFFAVPSHPSGTGPLPGGGRSALAYADQIAGGHLLAGTAALPKEALKGFSIQNALADSVCPEDVAKAALFFASDDSSKITGIQLNVDAGLTAHMPSFADTIRSSFDRNGIGASDEKAAASRRREGRSL